MKIRTDFVTNSSSSSFTVSIAVKTVDGKSYRATIEPDDGGGNGSADINCSAESLLNYTSVDALMDAIYDAVTVTTSIWGDDEQDKKRFAKGIRNLADRVKKNVHSLDQIDKLTFRKKWYAWGEYASCFGWNIGSFAPELCRAAKKLCKAYDEKNEEECEALRKELLFLLWSYDGRIGGSQGGSFPSGFMGSSAKCILDIYDDDDDLIDFAQRIAGGSVNDFKTDEGVETTIIDMQSKTIRQGAVYGDDSWDGIQEDNPKYAELLHFVSNRKRERYTEIRRRYMDLVNNIPFSSEAVDYWKKTFIGNDLPENDIYMLGGYSTSLNTSLPRPDPNSYDYWIVDTNPPPEAGDIPDCDVADQLEWLEWMLFTLAKTQDSGIRFIEQEAFLAMVEQQRQNNYPYTEAIFAAWKASIPFDHISAIDCQNKIIATASLGRSWMYNNFPGSPKGDWLFNSLRFDGEALSGAASTRDLLIAKGAIVKYEVTRNCDYLVVGLDAAADSPKVEKAIKQRDSGKSNIKIIPEDELLRIFSQDKIAKPENTFRFDQDAHIAFQNKHFVLTCFGLEESRVIAEIEKRGGIFHDSMVKQADYLVVCLKAARITTKYQKALEWRTKGVQVQIIDDDQLYQAFNEMPALSADELREVQKQREAFEKAEAEEKQRVAEVRIREAEAAILKKAEERKALLRAAEARREEKEARKKAAEAALEEIKKEREAQREARALQKAAEQAEKEEKQRLAAEERNRKIVDDVLYRPGEEPVTLQTQITKLFEKLDGAYPDKQISSLQAEHKQWSEIANEIRKLLGYPDSQAFLEAYGYTVVNSKGGRPSTVDPTAFIEELKRRYPNGSGLKTVAALKRDNGDLPFKTMTNNAQQLFGKSLGDYLKEIGVLG